MTGGGIGGTLGGLAGAALAPATGGLSIALPALLGAGGGYLGGRLTHSENPLMDALLGGVGGGLSGYAGMGRSLGIANSANLFDDAALSGASGLTNGITGLADAGVSQFAEAPGVAIGSLGDPARFAAMGAAPLSSAGSQMATGLAGNAAAEAAPSIFSQVGNYITENPLKSAVIGGAGLAGLDALMPKTGVDTNKNKQDVLSGTGFDSALPKYVMQNTATPYNGDWYKYGATAQTPMYSGQLQRLAHGGTVKGYAAGGMPQMPAQNMPQIPVNPLTLKAAHEIGVTIGQNLKNKTRTPHGKVYGKGGGHDDLVPAKLSQGEYVVSADIPSMLGDGSTDEGAKILDKFVKNVRAHKTSKGSKFPPRAKNPLAYLPKKVMA